MSRLKWSRAFRHVLVVVFIVTLALPSAQASIDTFMGDLYSSTSSSPRAIRTQSRMGFAGGSYHLRSPIRNITLYSIAAPRIDAGGCGGISLYGGAFSLITLDEAKQIIKQIGANAASVAFTLALRMVSEMLYNNIKEWVDKVDKLSREFRNTCQLAQKLASPVTGWLDELALQKNVKEGDASDAGKVKRDEEKRPGSSVAKAAQRGGGADMAPYGNLTYKALKENNNLSIEFADLLGTGTKEGREIVMSVFGTQLFCYDQNEGGENNHRTRHKKGVVLEPLVSIDEFKLSSSTGAPADEQAGSGEINVYRCLDDACCEYTTDQVELTGFWDHVVTRLDEIEQDILNQDSTNLERDENARFINAARHIPVVAVLTKYIHEESMRSMMKGAMAEYIADFFMAEFLRRLHSLSLRLYSGSDIPKPAVFLEVQEDLSERARVLASGNEGLEVYAKIMETIQRASAVNTFTTASDAGLAPGN